MVAQPDGKLLFPLSHGASPGQLIRLTSEGQPDPSFGVQGTVTLAGTAGGPHDVFVGDDGRLVAVGHEGASSKPAPLRAMKAA